MPTIHRTASAPYSAKKMYALVDDVTRYPEFIPWCSKSQEISRTSSEVKASLELSHLGMHKSFTTCNYLHPYERMEITLVDGPFKHLEGFWHFTASSETSCIVTLDLEFEFSNKLLGLAFGPVFNQAANMLVDAFTKRAHEVYGNTN